ncbi:MAG: hypothetical protein IJW30_00515 [Clostridia bacterium]|nr:hypothetical protein [Clostridia bacterium]
MNDKQTMHGECDDCIRDVAGMLQKLPRKEREKFLCMVKGAAIVAEAKERTEAAG